MKKFFTLFAAMLVAIAMNAAIDGGAGALSTALAGDDPVIELNDNADFTETSTVAITRDVTIKAAKDKSPVIKAVAFTISGGVTVKFEGIEFNATGVSSNVIVINSTGANVLKLKECEMHHFGSNIGIYVNGTNHADLIKIDSCYFHDATNSAIYVTKGSTAHSCDRLEVRNSTFAEIKGFDKPVVVLYSKGEALASDPADDNELVVDHCTFYNKTLVDTKLTYGFVDSRKSTKATISNCIFANPSAEQAYCQATYTYGGTVSNCLDYNTKGHRTACTSQIQQDPKFIADSLAIGKYNLSAESPALDAGTDGKTLGAPRWWPVITYPETDFSGAGYECSADDAILEGKESGKFYLDESTTPHRILYYDQNYPGTASWKITATRACFITADISIGNNPSNHHIFEVKVIDAEGHTVDSIAEGVAWDESNESSEKDAVKRVPGYLIVPSAGDYTIKLLNNRHHSKTAVYSVTLKYAKDIPTIKLLGAIMDDWVEHEATKSADGLSASYTYEGVSVQDNREFKVKVGNELRSNEYLYHRGDAYNAGVFGAVVTTTNATPMKFHSDKAGDYTFTWFFKNDSLAITFPTITRTNGYYLVGYFNGEWKNSIEDCTPDKLFEYNRDDNGKAEYILTAELKIGDKFKAVYVKGDAINSWYPNGSGDEYVISDSYHAGSNKTIYFRPDYSGTDWGCPFYVPSEEPTSLSDINATDQAVKRLENGQLVIIRGENAYTVTGVRIR